MPHKIIHPSDYFLHNHAQLVKGGHEYFDLLYNLINQAQVSIHLQTYIFDEDETGMMIAEALLAAASRKVNIFLLFDGYASQRISRELRTKFKEAGIRFRWFEPFLKSKGFYFGRRLHHKIVVIDSYQSLVGGMNISNRYNDLPDQSAWLDWALYTRGEVVPLLEDICKKRIRYYRYKLTNGSSKPPLTKEKCLIRVRVNDWVQGKRQISRSYLEMLSHASSHVIIMSPYFLPGSEIRKRMAAASKRGVKIKVMLAGVSDIAIAKWAERYVYEWLFRNKIEVYEYQKNVLHGKVAVYDSKWMTIGSYNVNNLSAYASVELNLDVDDEHLARHTEKQMEKIMTEDCVRVTEGSYNKNTSILKKMIQWIAYESLRLILFLTTFYFKQKE